MPAPPLTPAARRVLVAASVNALGTGFTLPFLLIYLHNVRGLPLALTGLVLASIGVAGIALSPLAGACIDRFGARPVQLVACVGAASGAILLTQVHTARDAFLAAVIIGGSQSAAWPSMNALIACVSEPEQRSRLYAVQFVLLNAGIGLGGAAGGLMADIERPATFQLLYVIDAGSFLAAGLVIAALRGVGGPVPQPAGPSGDAGPDGWSVVLRDRTMLLVAALFLVVVTAGYAQVESGFPAYSTGAAGVSTRVLGIAFAANTLVIVCGQLLILRRLERHPRTRAIAGFGVALGVTWALFAASGVLGPLGGPVANALVIATLSMFALGETLWSPSGNALVNDIAPPHLRGRYHAVGSVTWQLGMAAGPVLAGGLLGARLVWPYLATLLAASAVVVCLALALERRLTPQQNGVFAAEPAALA